MKALFLIFLFLSPFVYSISEWPLLREQIQSDFPTARVEVSRSYLEKGPAIPEGIEPTLLSPRPAIGWVSYQYLWEDKGVQVTRKGTALVRVFESVAVAKRPIRHGEVLDPANITFEEREISPYQQSGYYDSFEKIQGLRAKGYVAVGKVLGFKQTEEVELVERGQSVELVNQKGNIRIIATMRALEKGRLNQWIKVENPSSKKVLLARVTGAGTASLKGEHR